MPKDPKTGKKYPYTKAGKAAAKKAAKVVTTGARNIAKAAATVAKKSKTAKAKRKSIAKEAVVGGISGAGQGGVVKGLRKGALKRTPAQIARIRAGGRNAKKKRKAGKGHQK